MASLKKTDGFAAQQLLVLPQHIQDEMAGHPLTGDLYVTDIGYFPKAEHHFRERPEGSDAWILIYCAEGSGWVELQGRSKTITLASHSLLVIPAGLAHKYGAAVHDPWSIYWFHFKGLQAAAFTGQLGLSGEPLTLSLSGFVRFTELFGQIYHTLTGEAYSQQHHILASQTLRYLISTIGLAASRSRHEERVAQYMERVILYMNEQLANTVTLAELARHAGLSKPHLTQLFKQSTGHPPMDYFHRLKIQRACQLLDLTDLSVKEIGGELGISDPYYFSRMFKKVMGHSPTAYRNIEKG